MRISLSRSTNLESTRQDPVPERQDSRRDIAQPAPGEPSVTERRSRGPRCIRATIDVLRGWKNCACISDRAIEPETPQRGSSELAQHGSSGSAQRETPEPYPHGRNTSPVQYSPRTHEQSLDDLGALRQILDELGAYKRLPVTLATNASQAPHGHRSLETRLSELQALQRPLAAAASMTAPSRSDRRQADTSRELSRRQAIDKTETIASPNVQGPAFGVHEGGTPWASRVVTRNPISATSGQDGSSPSLYPPTQSEQHDNRVTDLGTRNLLSPSQHGLSFEQRMRLHFGNRGRTSAQDTELNELQQHPSLSNVSGRVPSLPSVAPSPSVYSNVHSTQSIPPLAYPENWQEVRRQDDNARLLEQALTDVEPARRNAYRPIIRGILHARHNLDFISFAEIRPENGIEVAGQLLARRVLGTAPQSTPVERINGWMGWLNSTWNMHQNVQHAESRTSDGSSTRHLDQLREQRRDQLRAFLKVCDEGNILAFSLAYPRPQTDAELDRFINSTRFAILFQAIQEVYHQMENATARGENIEVRYSSTGS